MSEKRLGGKKIKLPDTGKRLDRVFTYTLESMEEATHDFRRAMALRKTMTPQERVEVIEAVCPQMMAGDCRTLPAMLERAADLELAAVEIDARLGCRPSWIHAAEGLDLDVSLFLAGEENCCLDRRKQRLSEKPAATDPVRIVISTDARTIPPEAASAFVAAARLAAQFVPLEIWWQGSWLKEDGEFKGNGHVFHVPLVRAGEMDFSRLQFVLCSPARDSASFQIMFSRAFPAGLGWGAGKLDYSTLPSTTDFIPSGGLCADAESVAGKAASWIGLEPLWLARYNESKSNLQEFTPATGNGTEPAWKPPTAEERARWAAIAEQNEKDREEQRKREAADRAAGMLF